MKTPSLALLALAYLAFVSLGLPDTVLGVAWPSLRAAFELPQVAMGAVVTLGVGGYFLSSILAGRLVHALGVGALLALSSALVVVGLAGYALAPRWALFVPAAAVIGLGSGAIDSGLNGYGAHHFPARHLNWLHAAWSLGATAGPAIMTAVLATGTSYRAGYAILAAALAAMTAAFVATRRAWDDPGSDEAGTPAAPARKASAWEALQRAPVRLQIAIFFLYTGLEASTGAWAFTLLTQARGLGIEAGGSWTAAFWGALLTGRIVLGGMVDRVGHDRMLRAGTFAALLGAAAYAFDAGVVGRLGLLVLGASLAPIFPTLIARTPKRVGLDAAAHAIGFQVAAATLGSAVFPTVLGVLADTAGEWALGPACAALALLLLLLHELLLRGDRRASSPRAA